MQINELTEKEFSTIRDHIKQNYGINLGSEKKSLVYSRLRSVLIEKNIESFTEYFDYLIGDKSGHAAIQFIDKITTNHTFFMREKDHFTYFAEKVLPQIEETEKNKDLRIWCAGCSSGEESYTLQMIVDDYFKGKNGWNIQILATDISAAILSKAVAGVYLNTSIAPLPDNFRKNYFKPFDENSSIVIDDIKKNIIYRQFNLMTEKFPFKKKFHAIFCRNVMIYFDSQVRATLVQKFYDATEEGGHFFIGHSESLNQTNAEYKYVMPALYKKG